jgi:hypothetical protein
MVKRTLLGASVTTLLVAHAGGCAWLFQDSLPSGYSASTARAEPRCSTGSGWVVLDGVFAGLSAVSAISAAGDDTNPYQSAYVLSGAAWAIVHTASAISGSRWAGECRKAIAEWNAAEPEPEPERPVQREPRRLERAEPPQAAPAPSLRGFYCASSPSTIAAAVCTREKAACLDGRASILGAVPDLSACTLVETTFCFDAGTGDETERCAPSIESCAAQRDASGADTSTCTEQR